MLNKNFLKNLEIDFSKTHNMEMDIELFSLTFLKMFECFPRETPYFLNGIRELF